MTDMTDFLKVSLPLAQMQNCFQICFFHRIFCSLRNRFKIIMMKHLCSFAFRVSAFAKVIKKVFVFLTFNMFYLIMTFKARGGFRGGGGRTPPPPSGIRPPADPKGPPFDTFSEIHFWPTDPKIFLKAPLAPIYTNFEGERAPKKRDFFVKIIQKVPKNGFFDYFFKNLPATQKI